MMKTTLGIGLVVGSLFGSSVQAATGFSFLQLGPSVRSAGLGGASTALNQESGALFANPGGIAGLSRMDVSVMHSTWLEQMSMESVALAFPSSLGTFGVGALWLSTPGLERRGTNRELLGSFSATSWSGILSYSTIMDRTLSFGMSVKMIGEQLDDIAASGVALDVGGQWTGLMEGLTIGVALQHLGPPVTYLTEATALPTSYALGIAYQMPVGLLVALDWTYQPNDRLSTIRAGTQVTPWGPLAFRVGYSVMPGVTGQPISIGTVPLPTGWVGGIGVSLGQQSLDYAVVPVNGFGLTHRIGLRAGW